MKNVKTHPSVVDMVRAHSPDDPAFVRELEERLHSRRLVTLLSVLRCRAGLSQRDLAARMGCTQSKISKLESGKDADVSIGDLLGYLAARKDETMTPEQIVNKILPVEDDRTLSPAEADSLRQRIADALRAAAVAAVAAERQRCLHIVRSASPFVGTKEAEWIAHEIEREKP